MVMAAIGKPCASSLLHRQRALLHARASKSMPRAQVNVGSKLGSTADTVLVTGATGFIGSAVVRALLARGVRVRALVRPASDRANLAGLDVETALGDLRDPASIAPAMAGVRALYHVAADYRLWVPDPAQLIRDNVATTRGVMEAAQAAGVQRIVYTSSVATLTPDPHGPADETRAADVATTIGAYKQSKVAAERVVEAMIREAGLPAVIVNPSTPIGPRDIKPTPTGRIIVEAMAGRIPAFVESGLNLVHVDDVAAGHLAAFDRGTIGERYILGGQDVSLGAMLAEIARACGRRAPTIRIPRAPLFPLAYANEQLARLTGGTPFLTVDSLRMAKHNMFYTSAKAERVLGYHARPYQVALADAVAWFGAR
jgi:dihydroflavonol-4-reductase